jgi:anthranilate synthase component 2
MTRVLVIDNYDSFTYNLVQYLGELGAEIEIVRNDQVTVEEIASRKPDKIVISPGPCTPAEAGISVDVIKKLGNSIPILGVCLGHQAIGAAFGGNIVRAPELMHGKTSLIEHTGEGVFAGLPSPIEATRYHSLIIDRATMPRELHVTAQTGDGIVMGVRHESWPVEGVQFHPESVLTPTGKTMLKNFLDGEPCSRH